MEGELDQENDQVLRERGNVVEGGEGGKEGGREGGRDW